MKVLILALKDWANLGNILKKCLIHVGVDARFYTQIPTTRLKNGESIKKQEAIEFSKECDVIHFMHGLKPDIPIDLRNKKVVVLYGGSNYRQKSKEICAEFNKIVDCSLIQTYDLFGLGAKNEIWFLPPVDTENIKPIYDGINEKIIVGHYPSNPKGKGSKNINRIINNIRYDAPIFEYRYNSNRVLWEEQLERMSKVDIYIERMNLLQQGYRNKSKWYRTGVWGMTALEAAALGKIVITNFYGEEQYIKEYGKCALQVANSEKDMEKILIKLLSMSHDDLLKLKMKTRKWVETFHSFDVVGNKLRGIYENL
jgi:glycosyltransferase involved in cell wall biosynthesis